MRGHLKGWKAGCIGPAMVLMGAVAFVSGCLASLVLSILSMEPRGKLGSTADGFWGHLAMAGLVMVGAGLFVMLFQIILWLVRRAGVAQSPSKE